MQEFIESVFSGLRDALTWVVMLLPGSPFTAISNGVVQPYLGGLNWILPISEVLVIMQFWLSSITVFYAYQAILRWVKAIE